MSDVTEEAVVPLGSAPPQAGTRPAQFRRSFDESFGSNGGSLSARGATAKDEASEDIVGSRPKYNLPESVRKGLAALEKGEALEERPNPAASSQAAAAPAAAGTTAQVSPAGSSVVTPAAAAAAAPQPDAELKTAHERALARNAELLAENEGLKKRPQREMTAREKRLDEAERGYLDNSTGSIRRFLAAVHDVDDPESPAVTEELARLVMELNAGELKVPLDAQQAELLRGARTRMALERDKREMRAEREAAQRPQPTDTDSAHTQLIGDFIGAKGADGKSIADANPHLMALSEEFTGLKPNAFLLAVIRNGFETGEYDRKTQDAQLITAAAAKAESLMKAKYDRMTGSLRPTSTAAQPTPASPAIASPTEGVKDQSPAVRTITNASASVAPATLPATKPATTEEKPLNRKDFRNENEYRRAVARKYWPNSQ